MEGGKGEGERGKEMGKSLGFRVHGLSRIEGFRVFVQGCRY